VRLALKLEIFTAKISDFFHNELFFDGEYLLSKNSRFKTVRILFEQFWTQLKIA